AGARRFGPEVDLEAANDADVVDPSGTPTLWLDLVRTLVADPQAHVLEDRQDIRERDALARAQQLASQRGPVGLDGLIDAHDDPLASGESLGTVDVVDRRTSSPVGAIGDRERRPIAAKQGVAPLFPVHLSQSIREVAGPGPRHLGDPALDLSDVVVSLGGAAADDVMDARELRIG